MGIILSEKNQERFEKIIEILEKNNKAILIQPVGTGQRDIALKIVEENKSKRILYIFRSADRLEAVKERYKQFVSDKEQGIEFLTNKKLLKIASENSEKLDDIDFIIYDEVKTISGDEISKVIKELIDNNPDIKLLGLELADMELNQKLAELKIELFNLRFQHATNQLDNPMRMKEVKKTIAKIKTVLKERELGINE